MRRLLPGTVLVTALLTPGLLAASAPPEPAPAASGQAAAPLPPGDAAQERQRIASQRLQLQQQFAQEEQACSTRFAVNACIDGVRARQRAALAPLRERELQLDAADRQQRAAERRAAIAARQQRQQQEVLARQARTESAAAQPAGLAASATGAGPAPAVRESLRSASPPVQEQTRPMRAVDEEARAAAAAQRVRQAEARRQSSLRAQERIAERLREQADKAAHKGAPVRGLPQPSATPASGP